MSTERTPEQWLGLGDEFGVELAKVLTPGPYSHAIGHYGEWICVKCRTTFPSDENIPRTCPVPDPITIDWNMAMKWRDKTGYLDFEYWLNEVWKPLTDFDDCFYDSYDLWKDTKAQPKHYLIAAAMAAEKRLDK